MKTNKRIIAAGITTLVFATFQMNAQSNDEQRQRRQRPSIEQLFADLDANGDEKLSIEEVKGPLSKHFARIDANEDGYLTKEEIENAPKPERKGRPNNQ